ncbi:MAG: Dam family site-specific DNA-(adenine-N6)-methyltransferase [Actinomycetota bacterium]
MTREAMHQSGRLMPFLRWAGGKRWLVPMLPALIGDIRLNNYHEPFVGGASVFLGISPAGGKSYLADLSAGLMETYRRVRDDPDGVATHLRPHKNDAEHYYKVRQSKPRSANGRAARFIYLNHTSFNGIHRVNLAGVYNVPFGRRSKVFVPDRTWLREVSSRLQGVDLRVGDFEDGLQNVTEGDLVFLDPPYTVAHDNNGFIKYNQRLFSFADQQRLSRVVDTVRDRGGYYILTNAAHPSISELFEKGDRRITTRRRNSVGGSSADRGSAQEFLFTNLPDHE